MLLPDYIRVRQKDTGHELSIVASAFDREAYTKLKEPATRPDGTPLPPKYAAPKSLSSKKSDGHKAAPEKE